MVIQQLINMKNGVRTKKKSEADNNKKHKIERERKGRNWRGEVFNETGPLDRIRLTKCHGPD